MSEDFKRILLNVPRKVPIINTSSIAKENTISPLVYHKVIDVLNQKNARIQQNANDENNLKLAKSKPYKPPVVTFLCLDKIKDLKLVNNLNNNSTQSTVKDVGIETPTEVSDLQPVNNEANEVEKTTFLINNNTETPEMVNFVETTDNLETLFNTIEPVSEFKSIKTESYILDTFPDGFSCFQDQVEDNIFFSHEQTIDNSEQLKDNVVEPLIVNEEKPENVSNTVTNSFDRVIKSDQDQINQDDSFNTAHYVRRSSRKRKQIDILDVDGSDDDVWPSKRKSKGKERQRRKCDYDSMEYLPGKSYGRLIKNQAKRPYRYNGSNNLTYTADCFPNCNSVTIGKNSNCRSCILSKWNDTIMNGLLQVDMTTKQKLLHNLRQRLLGNVPGYKRPTGWLTKILKSNPVPFDDISTRS